ncbi:MAG: hypothetical protein A2Y10_17630 [Planctomycetes bacterium GWF2_41_51]|nr:MAG: hypothetical protein A2Y10_17630 [Planctomycetes bacterium GWF2_41_51]HBG28048.1 hypothetical protein [Phycisphaerales bacterium]
MNKLLLLILVLVMSVIADFAEAKRIEIPPITEGHPRLLLKKSDIEIIKQRINQKQEPWFGGWTDLKASLDKQIENNREPKPYTGPDCLHGFFPVCDKDANYARDLAMAYWITGEKKYADQSLKMLAGWAQNDPLPGADFDPNINYPALGMAVGRASMAFIWTYDLLYDYPDFKPEQKKAVEEWFQLLLSHLKEGIKRWEENDFYDKQYYQNHVASDCMATLAIGYAIGDEELVRYALDSEKNSRDVLDVFEGCILMRGKKLYYRDPQPRNVHNGEISDRYRHFELGGHNKSGYVTKPNRGLQYCSLTLLLMTTAAEIAYNNGVDLYSYSAAGGENLELCFDFYADFYRLKDDSLRGGYYIGEKDRIRPLIEAGVFELGYKRYPKNKSIELLLSSMDRAKSEMWILGRPAVYFGQPIGSK